MDLDFSDRVVDVIEEGFDAVVHFAKLATPFDDPGFGNIPPTPRGGPGLSGGQKVFL
jgi:hypothetical protein